MKVIAIDFDGCLCSNEWPKIGKPNIAVIERAKRERESGSKLILWTCREDEMLQKAINFCAEYGLEFDAHNDNLIDRRILYGNNCRKVGADEYWDDKGITLCYNNKDKCNVKPLIPMKIRITTYHRELIEEAFKNQQYESRAEIVREALDKFFNID